MSDIAAANLVKSKMAKKVLRNLVDTLPEARMLREAVRDGLDHSELVACKREMMDAAKSVGVHPAHMVHIDGDVRPRPGSRRAMIDGAPEPPRPIAIYALSSSVNGVPRYIGKTDNPNRRLGEHIKQAGYSEFAKDKWVFNIHKAGHLRMTVLEWTHDWEEAERRWIRKERDRCPGLLFNLTEGGK